MKIIIISHLPCSGGTFFTHLLADSLPCSIIIPEFNFFGTKISRSFEPLSPLSTLLSSDKLQPNQKKQLWHAQLNLIVNSAKAANIKYLILRDHFASEFLNSKKDSCPSLLEYFNNSQDVNDVYPIFTHRNPADIWNSLNYSFLQYLHKYNITLDSFSSNSLCGISNWRHFSPRPLFEIQVDTLYSHLDEVNEQLACFLDIPNFQLSHIKSQLTSGASGRHSSTPESFRPRKISSHGAREIVNNQFLSQLASSSGYALNSTKFNLNFFNGKIRDLYVPPLRKFLIKFKGSHHLVKKISSYFNYEIPLL